MQLILIIIAALVAQATAQNATVNLFLPTPFQGTIGFAASVFAACNGETTYGVRCTTGVMAPRFTCGPDTPEFTVTEASNQYIATKTSPISSAVVVITETCSLRGTTYASCTADIAITGSGKTTFRSTSSTLTGTEVPTYYMFQMPVTAGAEILHATGNVCGSSSAMRTTTPFIYGIAIGLFVFTAAIVL